MVRSHARRGRRDFLRHHSLSIASVAIVVLWIVLYRGADPRTHIGSFYGNAIADWTGVVFTVIATKYFYEVGSSESRKPKAGRFHYRVLRFLNNHSLTIFLVATGIGWTWLFAGSDSESRWGQVVGNIVSEWTQLLGLVLMTKRLIEDKSKESRR
jgi:hypothetical protein